MTKEQLRKDIKIRRDSIPESERKAYNSAIRNLLYQTPKYQECSNLFIYVSFGSEVETHSIINLALTEGKKVYIPRVNRSEMEFYQIQSLEGLEISKFGVSEPPAIEQNRYQPLAADRQSGKNLMLLPGLAFDRQGNRIGYGGGYYDKYLSGQPLDMFYKVAIAYQFQILDKLVVETHDIRADALITPQEIIIM